MLPNNASIDDSIHLLETNPIAHFNADGSCTDIQECPQLQFLSMALMQFSQFMMQQPNDDEDEATPDIDDLLEYFDALDLINAFNHLLDNHEHQFEDIYNILSEQINDKKPCDIRKCRSLRRNQRDRARSNTNTIKEFYGTNNIKEVVFLEIIDRIHCHYKHTFDIGYKFTKRERDEIRKRVITVNKSREEELQRKQWRVGYSVQVYSESQQKWCDGKITSIFMEEDRELLAVKYEAKSNQYENRHIARYSNHIKPGIHTNTSPEVEQKEGHESPIPEWANTEEINVPTYNGIVAEALQLTQRKLSKYREVEGLERISSRNRNNRFVLQDFHGRRRRNDRRYKMSPGKSSIYEQLAVMGFDVSLALDAVEQFPDDIGRAIEWIMDMAETQQLDVPQENQEIPDYAQRKAWKYMDKVRVKCQQQEKWFTGRIISTHTYEQEDDKDIEWLRVAYGKGEGRSREVGRYSQDVKPLEESKEEEFEADGSGTRFGLDEYRFGYRFFYWDYYKNMCHTFHDDVQTMSKTTYTDKHDANKDFPNAWLYITPKYEDMKEELSGDDIFGISKEHFEREREKAKIYLKSDKMRKMYCVRDATAINYGLRYKDPLTVDHIIAVMIYCNYDTISRKFSETYRRKSDNEHFTEVTKRHRNYYWMARRIREVVECYGMNSYRKSSNEYCGRIKLYHGATNNFVFESLFAYIKVPHSTSKEFNVAARFAGNEGIVLELFLDPKSWTIKFDEGMDALSNITCFDCQSLSKYPNEAEILCVGGLNRFHFDTIHEIGTTSDYKKYIKAIKQMTTGMTHGGIEPDTLDFDLPQNDADMQLIFRLMSHQFHKYVPKHKDAHKFKSCPSYIEEFIDTHCNSIRGIHVIEKERTEYANPVFDWFFRLKDIDWINFKYLHAIFPGIFGTHSGHFQFYAHHKDAKWFEAVLTDHLLPLFKAKYSWRMFRYPNIVIQFNPELQAEFNKIVWNYFHDFANAGWFIQSLKTNIMKEWKDNSPKIQDFMDAKGFLAKTDYIKAAGVLCLAAQKDGFDLSKDYEQMITTWVLITPKRCYTTHGIDFDDMIDKHRSELSVLYE